MFVDNAQQLILRAVPPRDAANRRARAVLAAIAECQPLGADRHRTTPARTTRDHLSIYEELARAGRYDLRNYVMLSDPRDRAEAALANGPRSALYDGRLGFRGVKLYADGALGSRGAALAPPYGDDPGNTRPAVTGPGAHSRQAVPAPRRGFQVAVHAIGDRPIRLVLDSTRRRWARCRGGPPFRIEHAQVEPTRTSPASRRWESCLRCRPTHQTSDMAWAEKRLGPERILGAYAWRSLLDSEPPWSTAPTFPWSR